MPAGTVVHFAPHPDDELIGAPATLFALRDAGWRVVNVALSLGRSVDAGRRERELREACERARYELVVPDGLRDIAHLGDGEVSSQEKVASLVSTALDRFAPQLIVSPSRHDRHPGHEVVGRAVHVALVERLRRGVAVPRWWIWGIWADLPLPTLITSFDHARLDEIIHCLGAYDGEVARNPYQHLVSGRAVQNGVLGCERVFGFGSANTLPSPLAELLTEVQGEITPPAIRWLLGAPRILDAQRPVAALSKRDASLWMDSPSLTERLSGVEAPA